MYGSHKASNRRLALRTEGDTAAPVVLIVDDEVRILNAMRRALRREELVQLGIQGPLAKPWENSELKENLRKALAVVARD